MLLPSSRYTPRDLDVWRWLERQDAVHARTTLHARRVNVATAVVRDFAAAGPCYVSTSWGKDSVVVAHFARLLDPTIPLVWVRVGVRENPDCVLVRDAFLAAWPGAYDEIHVDAVEAGTGSLARGATIAAERYGDRYISGVRGAESGARARRMAVYGHSTARACAPIGLWSGPDVFAYLHAHGLPVHPAYACSLGGIIDRERLRVAPIGGDPGKGHGREEWERRYYRETWIEWERARQ